MTIAGIAGPAARQAKSAIPPLIRTARPSPNQKRIPGIFQLLLALYIILTGDFPTIIQALSLGLEGNAGSEFAVAMLTSLVLSLLLLAPVLLLGKHPLGILHPLILAVVLWPIVLGVPRVIQDFGGWAGVLAGVPVETPFFIGLPSRSATTIWLAIAKYNALEILALLSTYLSFWLFSGKNKRPLPPVVRSPESIRFVMTSLLAFSLVVLFLFLYFRGGLTTHLTSLGGGRFRELEGLGPIIALTDWGSIALYVWIAARPKDVKSPVFLAALAMALFSQFVSNGSRGSTLMVPLIIGLIWTLRTRRVPWKLGLMILPVMFVAIGLLSAIRSSVWSNSTAGEVIANATWSQSFAAAQQDIVLRRSLNAQIPIIERGFAVTHGPLLGSTYVAGIAAFVPRALWPGKPRGAGPLYSQTFLGTRIEGQGIPVGPTAEAYWNFGVPGVLIMSFLYGWLLKTAYEFYARRAFSPFATVFYVIVVTTLQLSTKSLVNFQQQMLLLGLSYLAVAMLVPRIRYVRAVRPRIFARLPAQA